MIKRIVIGASFSRNEPRYAHAYELNGDDIVKDFGCIAEGRFEIIEDCEKWGIKNWGNGFEIVCNGIASSETIHY